MPALTARTPYMAPSQSTFKSLLCILAFRQMCERVLLSAVSIHPHHSLRALPRLERLHKHEGWGQGCSFTSPQRTSKSLLLHAADECSPSARLIYCPGLLSSYCTVPVTWGSITEPEPGHLLVLAVSHRPGFNSKRRTLILLIQHFVGSFSCNANAVYY